jgi:hypothetical protein
MPCDRQDPTTYRAAPTPISRSSSGAGGSFSPGTAITTPSPAEAATNPDRLSLARGQHCHEPSLARGARSRPPTLAPAATRVWASGRTPAGQRGAGGAGGTRPPAPHPPPPPPSPSSGRHTHLAAAPLTPAEVARDRAAAAAPAQLNSASAAALAPAPARRSTWRACQSRRSCPSRSRGPGALAAAEGPRLSSGLRPAAERHGPFC